MFEFSHYIVMSNGFPGYWGKGKSIEEAIKESQWIGSQDEVIVIGCGKSATITPMGDITWTQGEIVCKIGVGTVMSNRKNVRMKL